VQRFYLQSAWYGKSKAFQKPEAWAYYATQRRFKLDERSAKRLIAWDWRHREPVVPDADAARWFRADFQRNRIVTRYRQQQGAAHA
jgi:hypothetical protein